MDHNKRALIFWTESDGDYFHIHGAFGYEGDGRRPEWSHYREVGKDGLMFDALRITSQGNNSDPGRALYGEGIEYKNLFSVDLPVAVAAAKTLTTIERKLQQLRTVQGYPRSFAAFVGQVAQVVKAERFYFLTGPGGDIRATRYGIAEGMTYVDGIEREWRAKGQQQEVASV